MINKQTNRSTPKANNRLLRKNNYYHGNKCSVQPLMFASVLLLVGWIVQNGSTAILLYSEKQILYLVLVLLSFPQYSLSFFTLFFSPLREFSRILLSFLFCYRYKQRHRAGITSKHGWRHCHPDPTIPRATVSPSVAVSDVSMATGGLSWRGGGLFTLTPTPAPAAIPLPPFLRKSSLLRVPVDQLGKVSQDRVGQVLHRVGGNLDVVIYSRVIGDIDFLHREVLSGRFGSLLLFKNGNTVWRWVYRVGGDEGGGGGGEDEGV